MEQYIGLSFVPIGLLFAGIGILEKNYMFGIDNYLDKFSKKHNVEVDRATYCRFEGIQNIKTATGLLILDVIYFLFEIKDLKTMLIMLCIYGIICIILYYIKRRKFINMLTSKEIQYQ